jgi:apolipoprotein N-acyltransferase
MASANNLRHIALAVLATASTAILFYFGNGLDPLWPLMWVAPLPVLLLALRSSWRTTAITSALAMFLGCTNMWNYLENLLGTPAVAWTIIFGTISLIFAASVLLFRALALRGAPWSALLAFPALLVSSEYIRNLTTPHGTAGSLAYSQLSFLPILQLASITGPWGISFLLLLFPAALALGWHLHRTAQKQALRIVISSVGVIALALLFGAVRLATPASPQQVSLGLIAHDEGVASQGLQTETLFRGYSDEAQKLAARGAQVIVLPEKLGVVTNPTASDSIFQSTADKTRSTIIAGMVYVDAPVKYNEARVYTPAAPVASYDKQHMLPPFESDLKPGTSLTLLSKPAQTWGVAICKDMDFAQPARQNGNAGVGLLLVPAWDFNVDRAYHGHIAVMRGVEDGFTVARAAKNGFLTVSDTRGRILAETRSDSAPFASLIARVPAAHAATLYLLLGDWFAWFTLATLIFTLLRLYRLTRQPVNHAA